MTDRFGQIEEQIYYAIWKGRMTINQIAEYSDTISAMADDNGDDDYAVLVDMTETKSFAMDVSGLTRIARSDARIVAYAFVNGDQTAKFIGGMLDHLAKQDFVFVQSHEEALTVLREKLRARC